MTIHVCITSTDLQCRPLPTSLIEIPINHATPSNVSLLVPSRRIPSAFYFLSSLPHPVSLFLFPSFSPFNLLFKWVLEAWSPSHLEHTHGFLPLPKSAPSYAKNVACFPVVRALTRELVSPTQRGQHESTDFQFLYWGIYVLPLAFSVLSSSCSCHLHCRERLFLKKNVYREESIA